MLLFVCLAWAVMGGALLFGGLSYFVRYYWPERRWVWFLSPVVLTCLSAGITVALLEYAIGESIKGRERVGGLICFGIVCSAQSFAGALIGLSDARMHPRPPKPPPVTRKPLDDRYKRRGDPD